MRDWPFPIKIYALGRFAVVRDDVPLQFVGKSPKKPLELLKGMIAFGARKVGEKALATALWPQAEDPIQALSITLHRLRKLIGQETIERQDGYLSLNSRRVYVDVWALEHVLLLTRGACDTGDVNALVALSQELMAIYGGGLVSDNGDARWTLTLRDRLSERVLGQLAAAARVMERAGRHSDAAAAGQRAMEIKYQTQA